jgi:hypothetical protein
MGLTNDFTGYLNAGIPLEDIDELMLNENGSMRIGGDFMRGKRSRNDSPQKVAQDRTLKWGRNVKGELIKYYAEDSD